MSSPRWHKVLRDLWKTKTRTILVVLSIAVGVFAMGTVAHMNVIVSHDMTESYNAINPADAILYVGAPFDDELIATVRNVPGVRAAQGRRQTAVRFKSEHEDKWYPIQLFVISDYANMQISKVEPELVYAPDPEKWRGGAWPPPDREIVIERSSLLLPTLGWNNVKLGDHITIEMASGKQRELRIAGLAYDFGNYPAPFASMGSGYITPDTFEWLGESRLMNEIDIVVDEEMHDPKGIKHVVDQVRGKIEKAGMNVTRTELHQPGKMPLYYIFDAITLLLFVLGALALFLSVFLIVNTISAFVGQQMRQIGVMKALGARGMQIAQLYFATVMIFGILAIFVAIPFSLYVTDWFIGFMAYFMNFTLKEFRIPPEVIVFDVSIGLGVPMIAALFPIIGGTRMTVREAITNYGIQNSKIKIRNSKSLVRLPNVSFLSRPLLLSLRNTFRRKARMTLTLLTLIFAGTIFISNMNVRASLSQTLETALQYFQSDLNINFKLPYPRERVESEALNTPGVVKAEGWGAANAYRVRADGTDGSNLLIQGPPAASPLIDPIIIDGRWLLPDDENAIVIGTSLLQLEPDIRVGQDVEFKISGRKTTWRVIGIARTPFMSPLAYANYPYLTQFAHQAGDALILLAVTERHSAQFQTQASDALSERYTASGVQVGFAQTVSSIRERIGSLFSIIFIFLMTMTMLMAIVGGLGLTGTMSLNVLERTREIGVMRAIGASNGAITQIVLVEGILIGVISWVVSAILAMPFGKLLGDALGISMLQTPLDYVYSTDGALLWLALVTVIAAIASFLPARNASRLTVREVLAYE